MLSIVRIHNELLGTYGDRGNADVLAFRAHLNGVGAQVIDVSYNQPLPNSADIYLMGGAEDAAQSLSLHDLKSSGQLASAISNGAILLAICAGFQIIGESFINAQGEEISGLGLLEVTTRPGEPRCVGDIKIKSPLLDVELTGFENHGGVTTLGTGVTAFGQVIVGRGNGDGRTDGAYSGNVFGTYMHGPVLARNPELADLLLAKATGLASINYVDELAIEYAQWRRKVTK